MLALSRLRCKNKPFTGRVIEQHSFGAHLITKKEHAGVHKKQSVTTGHLSRQKKKLWLWINQTDTKKRPKSSVKRSLDDSLSDSVQRCIFVISVMGFDEHTKCHNNSD